VIGKKRGRSNLPLLNKSTQSQRAFVVPAEAGNRHAGGLRRGFTKGSVARLVITVKTTSSQDMDVVNENKSVEPVSFDISPVFLLYLRKWTKGNSSFNI
jgi:hypothetical protein